MERASNEEKTAQLYKACRAGDVQTVQRLLSLGVNVNDEYETPLNRAAENGHIAVVEMLLKAGADVNEGLLVTPLYGAASKGHIAVVEMLLKAGADVNKDLHLHGTPLYGAASEGHIAVVDMLLKSGADVNKDLDSFHTPLYGAASNGHIAVVEMLLKAGADVNKSSGILFHHTPLYGAASDGHIAVVEMLLKAGADVNESSHTPLYGAASNGHIAVVEMLLKAGADVNKSLFHHTPLYGAASDGHIAVVEMLLKAGADVNESSSSGILDGNTVLHVAAENSHESCVRLLLSTPGINVNPVNKRGITPFKMATSYDILIILEKYTTSCDDFPVHTHGKVIMCGDSGVGKSTLTEAIVRYSESMSEGGVDQHRVQRLPVKPLTAGIISHRVKNLKASMTVYDLAGHSEYYSSHSSILELISKTTPSVFLLLVDLFKSSIEQIIAQIYRWSAMIGNVCNKCPQQSSIIVVGTHADQLKDQKKIHSLKIQLPIVFNAMKQLTFIQFTALNVTSFSKELHDFMSLLHNNIDDVRMKCPAISYNCHLMYAFLNDKVPKNQDAISLSQLVTLLDRLDTKRLPTEAAEVSKLLKTLSEKGFIVFFDTNLADGWIVLRQDILLEKVNGVLFAPADFDEHIPIASNTGVIPISVLESHFPQYNLDMITQFLIRFELCQPIAVAPHDTTHERPPRPDLFFPPLVKSRRPDDVIIPSDAFCWQMCTTSIDQSFSPRFLHVLLRRIVDQFPLPTRDICLNPDLQKYNRSCTVWIRGISWMSEEGFTTVIEMSEDFRCLLCAVSTQDKEDTNYSKLVLSVCSVISKTCDEFCPSVSRVESITCPPEATLDHVSATVECEVLKRILVNGTAQVIDSTRKRMVIISKWREVEPQLNTFLGVHFKKDTLTASLTEKDHAQIFKTTKSASGQWRAIGGELGFTIDELDSITHEPGRHGDKDYYAAMLRRWLDWAPPNHTHPSLQSLQSALRAVGKERQANNLEAKYTK